MKDTGYYDKESVQYSHKRYPDTSTQYTHFFFKRRLALVLGLLAQIVGAKQGMKLLEVGCADGYVLSRIANEFDGFGSLIGIDISPAMIAAAQMHYASDSRMRYYVRDAYDPQGDTFDVIVEVGVLNLTDLRADLQFARSHLRDNGYYVCSLASSTSLVAQLKPDSREDYRHHLSFAQYERILAEYFTVERRIPYGLFIPHLWKVPALARIIQPAVEQTVRAVCPNAFHEKVYLLKKR